MNIQEKVMAITQEQDAKKSALQQIAEQTKIAREALAKAEAIAREAEVSFSFEIGDGYGYYETWKDREGKVEGYWDGWQGSNC
jgi:LmbE family N-acetylglucosaminyl deacetylase